MKHIPLTLSALAKITKRTSIYVPKDSSVLKTLDSLGYKFSNGKHFHEEPDLPSNGMYLYARPVLGKPYFKYSSVDWYNDNSHIYGPSHIIVQTILRKR